MCWNHFLFGCHVAISCFWIWSTHHVFSFNDNECQLTGQNNPGLCIFFLGYFDSPRSHTNIVKYSQVRKLTLLSSIRPVSGDALQRSSGCTCEHFIPVSFPCFIFFCFCSHSSSPRIWWITTVCYENNLLYGDSRVWLLTIVMQKFLHLEVAYI